MRRKDNASTKLTVGVVVIILAIVLSALLPSVKYPSSVAHADGSGVYVSTDTRAGRLAVFDNVWETIDERYYDPGFGGVDWFGPRATFRQAAADAQGSRELYEVLRRMIGALRDPHTRVYSPEEKFDWWHPRYVTIGVTVREVEGVPTVVRVEPNSQPARAGIRAGDQIETVDGIPAQSLIQKKLALNLQLTPNESGRFRAIAGLLEGAAGTNLRLSWKAHDGKVRFATFPRFRNQRKLGFEIKRLERKYLVIQLEAFTQSLVLDLMQDLKSKVAGVNGVILDLRGNGGGDADAMSEIAALFIGEGADLGGFNDRSGAGFQLTTHANSTFVASPAPQIRVPLAVLIGEQTSSAAEILAEVLKSQRHARLIGTTTCGCVLAIRARHTLPDDGALDVSEFDYRTAAGIRLEGRGVSPEQLILSQRRDLYSKRDRALQAALDFLKRR